MCFANSGSPLMAVDKPKCQMPCTNNCHALPCGIKNTNLSWLAYRTHNMKIQTDLLSTQHLEKKRKCLAICLGSVVYYMVTRYSTMGAHIMEPDELGNFSFVFLVYVVLCVIVFGCQYQCN